MPLSHFDPPGAQTVAGMHRSLLLVVTEPMRGAVGDARLARHFPFSEVEILARSFADLKHPQHHEPRGPADWQIYNRVPFPPDALMKFDDQTRS